MVETAEPTEKDIADVEEVKVRTRHIFENVSLAGHVRPDRRKLVQIEVEPGQASARINGLLFAQMGRVGDESTFELRGQAFSHPVSARVTEKKGSTPVLEVKWGGRDVTSELRYRREVLLTLTGHFHK